MSVLVFRFRWHEAHSWVSVCGSIAGVRDRGRVVGRLWDETLRDREVLRTWGICQYMLELCKHGKRTEKMVNDNVVDSSCLYFMISRSNTNSVNDLCEMRLSRVENTAFKLHCTAYDIYSALRLNLYRCDSWCLLDRVDSRCNGCG